MANFFDKGGSQRDLGLLETIQLHACHGGISASIGQKKLKSVAAIRRV